MSVIAAINKARASIGHIAKGSVAKAEGKKDNLGYTYQGWEDVLPAVRSACDEAGLIILPSIKNHTTTVTERPAKDWNGNDVIKSSYRTEVVMEFVLLAEGGEPLTMTWAGEAIDTGDKGMQKAATSATKYFLLKLFQVPTKEDATHDPDAVASHDTSTVKAPAPAKPTPPKKNITPQVLDIYNVLKRDGDTPDQLKAKKADAEDYWKLVVSTAEGKKADPAEYWDSLVTEHGGILQAIKAITG